MNVLGLICILEPRRSSGMLMRSKGLEAGVCVCVCVFVCTDARVIPGVLHAGV